MYVPETRKAAGRIIPLGKRRTSCISLRHIRRVFPMASCTSGRLCVVVVCVSIRSLDQKAAGDLLIPLRGLVQDTYLLARTRI